MKSEAIQVKVMYLQNFYYTNNISNLSDFVLQLYPVVAIELNMCIIHMHTIEVKYMCILL